MDLKDIKDLIRFFDKSGLAELEIEQEDGRLYLSKNSPVQTFTAPQNYAPAALSQTLSQPELTAKQEDDKGNTIESPMIGTYYEAPSPGAAPFVKVGDVIEKGQTLCIIEAMKIMNTIESEYRCKILRMLVQNGQPVEFGQPMFMVEPL